MCKTRATLLHKCDCADASHRACSYSGYSSALMHRIMYNQTATFMPSTLPLLPAQQARQPCCSMYHYCSSSFTPVRPPVVMKMMMARVRVQSRRKRAAVVRTSAVGRSKTERSTRRATAMTSMTTTVKRMGRMVQQQRLRPLKLQVGWSSWRSGGVQCLLWIMLRRNLGVMTASAMWCCARALRSAAECENFCVYCIPSPVTTVLACLQTRVGTRPDPRQFRQCRQKLLTAPLLMMLLQYSCLLLASMLFSCMA